MMAVLSSSPSLLRMNSEQGTEGSGLTSMNNSQGKATQRTMVATLRSDLSYLSCRGTCSNSHLEVSLTEGQATGADGSEKQGLKSSCCSDF